MEEPEQYMASKDRPRHGVSIPGARASSRDARLLAETSLCTHVRHIHREKVRDGEGSIARTRGACAAQIIRFSSG